MKNIEDYISVSLFAFEQPAGIFYSAIMDAKDVIDITKITYLSYDPDEQIVSGEPQRKPSTKRLNEICEYAKTPDACFPTSILLSIDSENCIFSDDYSTVKIKKEHCATIVDGQHRILGLAKDIESANNFKLPVVFLFDITEEQKALIFSTINGKQTRVPRSIIYEIFSVSESRSAYKITNDIASSLNSMPSSPWFRRLKILGKKTRGGKESLSQGTFIKELLPHITKDPDEDLACARGGKAPPKHDDCIFNSLYISNKDDIILKVLINYFSAIRKTWKNQWDDIDNSILVKSVGFSGVMLALKPIVKYLLPDKDLSEMRIQRLFENLNFGNIFSEAQETLAMDENKDISKGNYPTSAANAKKLCDNLLKAMNISS